MEIKKLDSNKDILKELIKTKEKELTELKRRLQEYPEEIYTTYTILLGHIYKDRDWRYRFIEVNIVTPNLDIEKQVFEDKLINATIQAIRIFDNSDSNLTDDDIIRMTPVVIQKQEHFLTTDREAHNINTDITVTTRELIELILEKLKERYTVKLC